MVHQNPRPVYIIAFSLTLVAISCQGEASLGRPGEVTAPPRASPKTMDGSVTISSSEDWARFVEAGFREVSGNLTISQWDLAGGGLESRAALEHLKGNLTIESNDAITNLRGLGSLRAVDGEVNITINRALENLEGLESLAVVGSHVRVSTNAALMDVTALQSLTAVGGDLVFGWNHALTYLASLESLTQVGGSLQIEANRSLTGLGGLGSVVSVGQDLNVSYTSLVDLDAMRSLRSVGRNLILVGNTSLANTKGLQSLSSVGGDVRIGYNSALSSLDGLSSLEAVQGAVSIYRNETLLNLEGLGSLTSIDDGLTIRDNAALTGLSGLAALTSVEGSLDVSALPALQDLRGLDSLRTIGGSLDLSCNVELTSLRGAGSLTSIGGNLVLPRSISLETLEGLESLTTVGGDLVISAMPALRSVRGLESLRAVGGTLDLSDNAVLTDLRALVALTSVERHLNLSGATAITNVVGLESLASVGGDLVIVGNSALTSIAGLRSLAQVGGQIKVSKCDSLTSLRGLDALAEVGGQIEVSRCNSLTSLRGLDALAEVGGHLSIMTNPRLKSLEGLESLVTVKGIVTISKNDVLNSLAGIESLTQVGGLLIDRNQALPRNSVVEVADGLLASGGIAGPVHVGINAPSNSGDREQGGLAASLADKGLEELHSRLVPAFRLPADRSFLPRPETEKICRERTAAAPDLPPDHEPIEANTPVDGLFEIIGASDDFLAYLTRSCDWTVGAPCVLGVHVLLLETSKTHTLLAWEQGTAPGGPSFVLLEQLEALNIDPSASGVWRAVEHSPRQELEDLSLPRTKYPYYVFGPLPGAVAPYTIEVACHPPGGSVELVREGVLALVVRLGDEAHLHLTREPCLLPPQEDRVAELEPYGSALRLSADLWVFFVAKDEGTPDFIPMAIGLPNPDRLGLRLAEARRAYWPYKLLPEYAKNHSSSRRHAFLAPWGPSGLQWGHRILGTSERAFAWMSVERQAETSDVLAHELLLHDFGSLEPRVVHRWDGSELPAELPVSVVSTLEEWNIDPFVNGTLVNTTDHPQGVEFDALSHGTIRVELSCVRENEREELGGTWLLTVSREEAELGIHPTPIRCSPDEPRYPVFERAVLMLPGDRWILIFHHRDGGTLRNSSFGVSL